MCLIQITVAAEDAAALRKRDDVGAVVDYLVDPLRVTRLDALGKLFADPDHEVIIHAAENDILLFQREFDFSFANVFDTQLAARILGWERAGLAAILEEQFGVVSDKRMQRTNWGKRPLTPEQIVYAQMDTHYLFALRERLVQELRARDRWEEAQEAFAELVQARFPQPARGGTQSVADEGDARRAARPDRRAGGACGFGARPRRNAGTVRPSRFSATAS